MTSPRAQHWAARIYQLLAVLAVALACSLANATNYPCSGMKGGISHCMGQFFVCNNGTTSQSKKDCRAYTGSAGKPDAPASAPMPKPRKP